MSRIDFGELTADEIRKLDAYGQVGLLSWLYDEIKRLTDLKMDAITIEHDAKAVVIESPSPAAKATAKRAEGVVKRLTAELTLRGKQASILQTLMRAIPH